MKKTTHIVLSTLVLCSLWSSTAGAQHAGAQPLAGDQPFAGVHPFVETQPDVGKAWASSSRIIDNTQVGDSYTSLDIAAATGFPEFTGSAGSRPIVPDQVLVKYKHGTASAASPFSAASLVSIKSMEPDNQIGAVKLELPAGSDVYQTITALQTNPDVLYAQPVYTYQLAASSAFSASSASNASNAFSASSASSASNASSAFSASASASVSAVVYGNDLQPQQWGIKASHLDSLWEMVPVSKRAAVKIAIVDSGIDLDHPDLKDSLDLVNGGLNGRNFVTPSALPGDDNGHGTHVAGIAAAITNNALGIAGVAGGVRIIPVKVTNAKGTGDSSTIGQGIAWAADQGAAVINLSLGGDSDDPYLLDTIRYAQKLGVLVVAASGNESNHPLGLDAPVTYPAAYSGVLSVGAINEPTTDDISNNRTNKYTYADFSNVGPELKVVAPGKNIYSTIKGNSATIGDYGYKDGTSMATPFVTGLAAMLKAADPALSADQLQSIITATATDLGAEGRDNNYGNGLIDGVRAFETPRLALEASLASTPATVATVATATYTYMPFTIKANDYNRALRADLQSAAAGNVLLKVSKYNETNGEWLPVKYESPGQWVASDTLPDMTVALSGGTASVGLELPLTGVYSVSAVAESGTAGKLYVPSNTLYSGVVVPYLSPNNYISKIYYDAGVLVAPFNKNILNHTLYVSNTTTSLSFGALLENKEATMTFNGVATPDSTWSIRNSLVTGSNSLTVSVRAPNGSTRTYVFNIVRLMGQLSTAMLKNAVVGSGLTFYPSFNPEQLSYQTEVDYSTSTLALYLYPILPSTTIKSNNLTIPGGDTPVAVSLNVGSNTFSFTTNGADGDTKTYIFTVTRRQDIGGYIPTVGGGGGGGCGSCGFGTPTIGAGIPNEAATGTPTIPSSPVAAIIKPSNELLKSQLETSSVTQVTIDAKTGNIGSGVQVEFNASILQLAASLNKSILIDTGRHLFELPPGAIAAPDSSAVVKFNVIPTAGAATLDKKPAQSRDISSVFDFSVTVGADTISSFAKPLHIQWKVDLPQGVQPAKLGVYTYNQAKQSWDYVGGKATDDGWVTFTTNHFSQFVVLEYNKTFTDMATHWAKAEVEQLAAKFIVTGISDNTFGPEQKLTRAEFAALLVRTLGIKEMKGAGTFQDVKPTDWYNEVVYQAYGAGLIEGLNDATFAPNQLISREQMAVMIMRAYSLGTGIQASDIIITQEVKFTDEEQTSSWARSSVRLANGLSLLGGFPDGSFQPLDTASRAQAAVLIKRLLDLMEK